MGVVDMMGGNAVALAYLTRHPGTANDASSQRSQSGSAKPRASRKLPHVLTAQKYFDGHQKVKWWLVKVGVH
jgi:hypothetical protein